MKKEKGIIIARGKNNFLISNSETKEELSLSFNLYNKKITPTIGDYIIYDKNGIKEILERKNKLIRPNVANVDQMLLIFSLKNPDTKRNWINRSILIAESAGIKPILVLTKTDLALNENEINDMIVPYQKYYEVYLFSEKEKEHKNLINLRNKLNNKKTILYGDSGVGKSTLINYLFSEIDIKTREISEKIKRGRHTTTGTRFYFIGNNSYIIDSPGFSIFSLKLLNVDVKDLNQCFLFFRENMHKCKFRYSCKHMTEPNCYIKESIEKGLFSEELYKVYLDISK